MARYDSEGMIPKPNKMSERWFRKMLARQSEVSVNGQEFTLQSVSPQWYYNTNDQCGMTTDKGRDTARYMDLMFKNSVVSPPEVSHKGMRYFNERGDIETPEKLLREIEMFLRPGRRSDDGPPQGAGE